MKRSRPSSSSDTGTWSRYSVGGPDSTLNYHVLLRDILGSLCHRQGNPVYCDTEARFTLLDSTQKKVQVIEQGIALLGLKHVSAVWARGEDHLARTRHDVVLMRAVSSVRETMRPAWCIK